MDQLFYRRIIYLFLLLFLAINLTHAMEEYPDIKSLFKKANVNGTFVLYDLKKRTIVGHNKLRAEKRYIPASTFKIANSLIGLGTGAVKSVYQRIPYTGPSKPFIAAWKRDMGLRDAIALSNVPIYQELARRIGLDRMRAYLKMFHYGNERTGEHVERFWLDGPLEISAVEQVHFLKDLVEETLPVPKQIQKDVREILLLEQKSQWRLYGKTGWQNAPGKGIGWFVGWLETPENRYIFALNMQMNKTSDAPKRVALSKACLRALGLLE